MRYVLIYLQQGLVILSKDISLALFTIVRFTLEKWMRMNFQPYAIHSLIVFF